MDCKETDIELKNLNETALLAKNIAKNSQIGDVIALKGGLGTGKTAFAKEFINSFFDEKQEVPSPTFSLIQVYKTEKIEISHFDLYRIESEEDAIETGIEDYFSSSCALIEWPEIIEDIIPEERLELEFDYGKEQGSRSVKIKAYGKWVEKIEGLENVAA